MTTKIMMMVMMAVLVVKMKNNGKENRQAPRGRFQAKSNSAEASCAESRYTISTTGQSSRHAHGGTKPEKQLQSEVMCKR